MKRMQRILFVVNESRFFLTHRLPIALAAKHAGFDVHVATPQDETSRIIEQHGLTFHCLDLCRSGLKPWSEAGSLIGLYRLYRRLRPDIVHHVTIKPVLYGGIAARMAKVPAVVMAISGLGHVFVTKGMQISMVRRIVKLLYRFVFKHPNCRVIFQNQEDLGSFLKMRLLDSKKAVLIRGSGVNIHEFRPTPEPEGSPVVLMASRMLWNKGVGVFVETATRLKQSGVQARFVLVGDSDPGNPASISREQLAAWRAEGFVEWWGRCEDMPNVMSRSTIVCLPSRYGEGVPKVLLEAAACGRPIAASNIPGCREIVRHEENGLLVEADDPEDLGCAVLRLIENPLLRRSMGLCGREIVVTKFTVEDVIDKTLSLYEMLKERCSDTRASVGEGEEA